MGHWPWAMAHGHGPWAMAHGSWPTCHGPWAVAYGMHGPWLMAHGSWAMAHVPWPWAMAMKTFRGEPCEQFRQTKQNRHSHIVKKQLVLYMCIPLLREIDIFSSEPMAPLRAGVLGLPATEARDCEAFWSYPDYHAHRSRLVDSLGVFTLESSGS